MPPKQKYSKDEIIDCAFAAVRKHGEDFLSARSLAAELGTSTAPLFTAFDSIEEIRAAVTEKAKALYLRYLNEGLQQSIPFKGAGLKYVQFAKDEPMLFRMLFMHADEDPATEASHYFPSGFEPEPQVRDTLQSGYGWSEEKAKSVYNHLSVYTHGLAVLYAQGHCVFTDEDISRMLSEVFAALTRKEKL